MWKVIDKFGLILVNIFKALKFAAYDYDAKMRLIKTDKQRIMTWIGVAFVSFILVLSIFMMIGSVISTFLNKVREHLKN